MDVFVVVVVVVVVVIVVIIAVVDILYLFPGASDQLISTQWSQWCRSYRLFHELQCSVLQMQCEALWDVMRCDAVQCDAV